MTQPTEGSEGSRALQGASTRGARLKTLFGVFAFCAVSLLTIQWARTSLFARAPATGAEDASMQAYAATLVKFEASEAALPEGRGLLGFGFSAALEDALKAASPAFQKCRQHFREGTGPVAFQVKVRPKSRRLRVTGILSGVAENAPHATCLRDVLEATPFAFLEKTPEVDDEKYTLQVALTAALASDVSVDR